MSIKMETMSSRQNTTEKEGVVAKVSAFIALLEQPLRPMGSLLRM